MVMYARLALLVILLLLAAIVLGPGVAGSRRSLSRSCQTDRQSSRRTFRRRCLLLALVGVLLVLASGVLGTEPWGPG